MTRHHVVTYMIWHTCHDTMTWSLVMLYHIVCICCSGIELTTEHRRRLQLFEEYHEWNCRRQTSSADRVDNWQFHIDWHRIIHHSWSPTVTSLLINSALSPVSTTRVNGPSWRVTGFHYPSTWAELTGNGNRAPVNSGSGNRALLINVQASVNSVALLSVFWHSLSVSLSHTEQTVRVISTTSLLLL